MDYKIKEIILNYFTEQCDEEIQTAIGKYGEEANGDEKIRETLSVELDRLLLDASKDIPNQTTEFGRKLVKDLLEYIYNSVDTDELVTYLDWE